MAASEEMTKGTEGMLAGDIGDIDIFSTTYKYKGVTLLGIQPPEVYDAIQTWPSRDDDIFLFLYPKSGTHWIFEIANLIVTDVKVEDIDRSHMQFALDMSLAHSVDGLETITPGYEAMNDWPSPRVMVTYMMEELTPEHIKNKKIIVWNRNPKDVAVSYHKFLGPSLPPSIRAWNDFLPYFLSDEMFGGSWFQSVQGWEKHRGKPNFLFCRYEDFQKDLKGQIKRVADFLERPLSDEKLDKMVELSEIGGMRKTYQTIEDTMGENGKTITRMFGQLPYLRKGKVGGWKNQFTVAQNELFDKIYKERMEGSGIEFEFEI